MSSDPPQRNQAQFDAQVAEFEAMIEALRHDYEQYFLGNERFAPDALHQQVKRTLRRLNAAPITRTVTQFKLRNLSQRLMTYSTYWNRILRQIEDGTYVRHVKRAQRRQQATLAQTAARAAAQQEANPQQAVMSEVGALADEFLASLDSIGSWGDDTSSSTSASSNAPHNGPSSIRMAVANTPSHGTPNRTTQASSNLTGIRMRVANTPSHGTPKLSPPSKPAASPPRPQDLQRVYQTFRKARAQCGQGDLDFDTFRRSVAKQREHVKRSHQCRDVEFKVVVRDGRSFLQPVIKR